MWCNKLIPAVCIMLMASASPCVAQEQQKPKTGSETEEVRRDLGSKALVELPLEGLLVRDADSSKKRIESAAETVLDPVKRMIEAPAEGMLEAAVSAITTDDNPACEPGLVDWHKSFEAACAASRQSGKPVMLFQLLGQLDQRFT